MVEFIMSEEVNAKNNPKDSPNQNHHHQHQHQHQHNNNENVDANDAADTCSRELCVALGEGDPLLHTTVKPEADNSILNINECVGNSYCNGDGDKINNHNKQKNFSNGK